MEWLAVIGGAGVGLTASVVALVDLVSSQKYVCTDNTADDMVVAAQVIDGLRVFTGLAVTALVAWAYSKRLVKSVTDADRSAIQNNAAGMVVLIIVTLTIDNILRSRRARTAYRTTTSCSMKRSAHAQRKLHLLDAIHARVFQNSVELLS